MSRPPRRHGGRRRPARHARLLAIAPLLVPTPAALAQTAATWLAPTSGTWSDPLNWSTNPTYPNDPSLDALLSATGSPYTVTLNSPVSLHSLTSTSPDATLNLTTGGTLTLSSTLNLGPGSLTLTGGSLSGGTLKSNVTSTNGTLDSLSLAAELTVAGPTTAAGSFSLNGGSIRFPKIASLSVVGNTLTGTGTVLFDNPSGNAALHGSTPTAFTLGPNITLRTGPSSAGGLGYVGNQFSPLVNQGTISAQTPGSTLMLYANGLTNTGTIEVTNNATLRLYGGGNNLTPASLSTINTSAGGVAYTMATNILNFATSTYTLSAAHAVGLGIGTYYGGGTIASADGTPLTIYSFTPLPSPPNPNPAPTGTATLTSTNVLAPVSVRPGATLLSYGGNTFSGGITVTGGTLTLNNTWSSPGPISLSAGSTLNITGTPAASPGPAGPISLDNSTANITAPLTPAQMAGFSSLNNATLNVTAALDNTGNTLPLPAGSTLNLNTAGTLYASITGGTIGTPGAPNGTVVLSTASHLNDVTLAANLTVPDRANTNLSGTTTLAGTHISIVGNSDNNNYRTTLYAASLAGTGDLTFDGTGTFTDLYYVPTLSAANGQTLPAGLTIRTGSQSGKVTCSAIAGTASAETPGKYLLLDCYGLLGTLRATNGATLVAPDNTSSLTGPTYARTLATGTWIATDHSNIIIADDLGKPVPVIMNAASVTLAGPTSSFPSLDTLSTNAGSFTLTDGRSFTTQSDLTNTGSLTLGPSASLTVAGTLTNSGSLSLSPTSTLSLAAGPLLWHYTGTSPLNTIRQYLHDAQLTSPAADSTHRLAYADSGSSVAVSLTITGNANLDGVLNADDYALLDRSYARSLSNAHWSDGDFNYDGIVDQNDYLLIDTTLGQAQQGFSPGFLSQRESQFGAPYVSTLLASVPEPALPLSSILYLLSSLHLPRRRQR